MTDKKKRGRPPGSKGKPKVNQESKDVVDLKPKNAESYDGGRDLSYLGDEVPQYITPSPLEKMAELMQDVDLINKAIDKLKSKPAHYDPFKNALFNKKMGLKDK